MPKTEKTVVSANGEEVKLTLLDSPSFLRIQVQNPFLHRTVIYPTHLRESDLSDEVVEQVMAQYEEWRKDIGVDPIKGKLSCVFAKEAVRTLDDTEDYSNPEQARSDFYQNTILPIVEHTDGETVSALPALPRNKGGRPKGSKNRTTR